MRLGRLVAPFHQFETAVNAGWSVQFTLCLEAPGLGGMGFHYGNPAYVEDGGAVNLLQPELLLYEPQKNGQMPSSAWSTSCCSAIIRRPSRRRPCWGTRSSPYPTLDSGACTSM
jgi:hypothetical protein